MSIIENRFVAHKYEGKEAHKVGTNGKSRNVN